MKEKKPLVYTLPRPSEPAVLQESAALPGEHLVTVRDAKAHLSALLEWVAGGRTITITSDGTPKARLVSVQPSAGRRVFEGMGDFLRKQPVHRGISAEQLVREDRDGRGW